jgi:hypothetical protein
VKVRAFRHQAGLWLLFWTACSTSAQHGPREGDASSSVCTACVGCEETLQIGSALHVTGKVAYDDPPPAGGPHNSCWGSWGVQQTELPPERWVHNLEHGGVVFLYRCEEPCDADVATLAGLVKAHPRTILTSYAQLPTRFAVVAWGHRLLSDCLDQAAFEAFYAEHVDRAPESISDGPPAACSEFSDL